MAVLGPLADSWLSTFDDYAVNAQPCFGGGSWPNFSRACVRTVLDGVRRHRPNCAFNQGLKVTGPGEACSAVDPVALQLGAQAQAVVLVVASDMNSEQREAEVLALRKPTVVGWWCCSTADSCRWTCSNQTRTSPSSRPGAPTRRPRTLSYTR